VTDSLLDDIRKALQGEKKSEFLSQILKEKALYDALHEAGLTVVAEDVQARAREQPYGVLSKVMKIDLVDLISEISLIDNITNIGTLDKINDVSLIESITNISNIDFIGKIKEIVFANFQSQIMRNYDFSYGLTYWTYNPTNVSTIDSNGYCDIPQTNGFIRQKTLPFYASQLGFLIKMKTLRPIASGTTNVRLYIYFTDATNEQITFAITDSFDEYYYVGTTGKRIQWIELDNQDATYHIKVAFLSAVLISDQVANLLNPHPVTATQTTRTNLKVQNEREDIVTKSWDLTAGTSTLLSAVSGQRHKVYGWDYEADTDGANEFSATIGGVTVKFGRRKTKGVHAMGLPHPIVCDVNTALSFISAGNTSLSLRYVTEA